MTRGDIITEGLSQAGRSDLLSNARIWLNDYLEEIYMSQDLYWLIKHGSGMLTQNQPLPSDYRSLVAAAVGPSRIDLQVVGAEEWQSLPVASAGGAPNKVYPDEVDGIFKFWPNPVNPVPWTYSYYYIPILPDPTDAASDLLTPVWKLPNSILKKAVFVKALEYNDDSRAQQEAQALDNAFARAKLNNHDLRAGKNRFALGKSFTKRF